MVCIYCGGNTRVTNSRPQRRLHQTWRRRACTKCNAIFTTNEVVDLATSLVVRRKDNSVTAFDRDQLFVSILQSVGHREHPVKDAGALTATVIAKLLRSTKAAILKPSDITDVVTQTLKHFDNAAAVQYTAYHKN
jgi:transcriptional regulator NrdR family protein